jgi:hypothetical protein
MVFQPGKTKSIDEYIYQMRWIKSMNLNMSISLLYPKMMRIDQLSEEVCLYNENCIFIFPDYIRLSYERLSEEGVYLIGRKITIYLLYHLH